MRLGHWAAAGILVVASPVAGEVTASSEAGFVSRNTAHVPASRQSVWDALIAPSQWWSGVHTYSGQAANMSLKAEAGGCFCEQIPAAPGAVDAGRGTVEHMRVIHADPGRMLRLSGGLGPLQSEGVAGTLTVTLKPVNGQTEIVFEYVVGGYMRYKPAEIAPLVDKVLGEQLDRLAATQGRAGLSPR